MIWKPLIAIAFLLTLWILLGRKKKAAAAPSPGTPAASQPVRRKITLPQIGKILKGVVQAGISVFVIVLVAFFVYNTIKDIKTKARRVTSGAFFLDPVKGEVRTGIFSKLGEYELYEQDSPPVKFWRKNTDRANMEIAPDKFTAEVVSPGEIILIPGDKPNWVRVWITNRRRLFGT